MYIIILYISMLIHVNICRLLARLRNETLVQHAFSYISTENPEEVAIVGEVLYAYVCMYAYINICMHISNIHTCIYSPAGCAIKS